MTAYFIHNNGVIHAKYLYLFKNNYVYLKIEAMTCNAFAKDIYAKKLD